LVTIFPIREYVEASGLMSYGLNFCEHYGRATYYVDGVYKVRTQATYQSRYQKHLNSSSTSPLQSRSAPTFRGPYSPADEVIELVATSVVGGYC
jgi:hypothetical protein